MQQRNPIVIFLLGTITCGIYMIVWMVQTKEEMNAKGNQIPTAWLLIVPFVGIWWLWKYSEAVEKVTGGKTTAAIAFILLLLLGVIGAAVIQNSFNQVT